MDLLSDVVIHLQTFQNIVMDTGKILSSTYIGLQVVHNKPHIKNGHDHKNDEAAQDSPVTVFRTLEDNDGELRGDISIWGLWRRQIEAIMDVMVTNSDAKSYLPKLVKTCLEDHEKERKDKYLKLCMEHRKDFTPFVCTADEMLAHEAHMTLKQIA
eukprot:2431563-Ditylum_brightwellii.AAC.1